MDAIVLICPSIKMLNSKINQIYLPWVTDMEQQYLNWGDFDYLDTIEKDKIDFLNVFVKHTEKSYQN